MRNLLAASLLALFASTATHAAALSPPQQAALKQLVKEAEASHSDAMVIWKDGKEIGHYYAGGSAPEPIELMSVTKSVVSLGIGQLIDEGKIKSLDQPVADFYPEWRQGQKAAITVRMLLDHYSGIQAGTPGTEIYPAPDAVQLALAAELDSPPGTRFVYNNKAVNLLAGIVLKVTGKPMDGFFREGLFKAMDITPGNWETDKAGNPYAMAGLPLTAADLGKLGALVMQRGEWKGKQLVSTRYIDAMLQAQGIDECGLLWWRKPLWIHLETDPASFEKLRKAGVPEATVAKLEKGLKGASYDNQGAVFDGVFAALGPDGRSTFQADLQSRGFGPNKMFKVTQGPVGAFYGDGDGGQSVVVIPAAHIVAVRQIAKNSEQEEEGEGFEDFADLVIKVAAVH
ncbi:serine hydrolase domain-containing protein [Luteibacter yeojuensis]|uniref:6-aminohexanoate hydrolase n=1 Tax=Luteibacter yeojuensis TaxID=345309 RepID=A0A0F3L255_9GAMM|nr:serine hydrolase [Luteibacter yeojuensis]KJV36444.1 6-aminohexanoate hydrolase [Luteibacter yeojuensis]